MNRTQDGQEGQYGQNNQNGKNGQTENGNANGSAADVSCLPLSNLSPEEITLAASVFAIIIAEGLSDRDVSLLASFLSTTAGNMALFLTKRTMERTNPIPSQ